jgi:hypothetical protein
MAQGGEWETVYILKARPEELCRFLLAHGTSRRCGPVGLYGRYACEGAAVPLGSALLHERWCCMSQGSPISDDAIGTEHYEPHITNGSLLAPRHMHMLRDESGIPEELILQRGYCTVEYPRQLRDYDYSKIQSNQVPGLRIPIYSTTGAPACYTLPRYPRRSIVPMCLGKAATARWLSMRHHPIRPKRTLHSLIAPPRGPRS